jgi:hypothetical protein
MPKPEPNPTPRRGPKIPQPKPGTRTGKPSMTLRDFTATTADIEECFGVTKAYLGQLEADGKIEKAGRNAWPFYDTVSRFVAMLKNRKVNQHDAGVNLAEVAEQYERDKGRKMTADADIAEITAALMAGRVHEGKAVEELWISQLMAARSKFLAMPSKLAALCPAEISADILKEATDLIHEVLDQLGDYDPQKIAERTDRKRVSDPTPTADDAPMEAAAQAESEPMG